MGTIDVTAIILAIISFLSGLGWMLDRKKHRQEVEALRADVKQKELYLSKDYVTEWRTYIAEPLQREVGELRNEVAALRNAIQKINFVFLYPEREGGKPKVNDKGDTLKVVQITDLTRARSRDNVVAQRVKTEVRVDTVYVEKRDSVYIQNTNLTNDTKKKSGFLTYVKWIFALVCAVVVLVITVKVCLLKR